MHVLKTTSPLTPFSTEAPKRSPSKAAPDSRTRRPRRSATAHRLNRKLQSLPVLVDDTATKHRHEDSAMQLGAEKRRVPRFRRQRLVADHPTCIRIKQRARRVFTDA